MSTLKQDKDFVAIRKREIKPIFTKGHKHIPHLKEKLLRLYGGFLPGIRTNRDHAAAVGVSPATFATWLTGALYKDAAGNIARANPESIPFKYYRKFVETCGFPAEILETADLKEFESKLDYFDTSSGGGWSKLVDGLPDNENIEMIAENATRTLVDEDEEDVDGIPRFRVGERIMVRVPNQGLRHGLMLEEDRGGWFALRPKRSFTDTELDGPLLYPRQYPNRPPRFARLDGVGLHRIVVVLTKAPLPAGALQIILQRPIEIGRLNYVASAVQKMLATGRQSGLIMSRRFLATAV